MSLKKDFILFILGIFIFTSLAASAEGASSSSYTINESVIFPGGYGTSTSFSLTGVISEMATGSSTSSTKNLFAGFLYFPFVSTPIVSVTPGNALASLTWTSSSASVGWAVSGYSVGKATASGGPYTYTDVGNVLAHSATGLTNGTPYYFVIRVIDALGYNIATSTQVTVIPAASSSGGGGEGGGGGGGGGGSGGNSSPITANTNVVFAGRAYPKSTVTLLKDAQVAATTIADSDANFQVTISSLSSGNYIFSVYSEDGKGVRSSLLTFPISVTSGVTTRVGGIFIAPSIAVDKSEVRRGDNIVIFGQSAPSSEVTININSEEEFFVKKMSDAGGAYLLNFDTSVLEMGQHSTRSKASLGGEISSFSKVTAFTVGTKNVPTQLQGKGGLKADLNKDGKVNLVDFSIIAYWYKRANPPVANDLNEDGKVDLIDFSIMAFNWTG